MLLAFSSHRIEVTLLAISLTQTREVDIKLALSAFESLTTRIPGREDSVFETKVRAYRQSSLIAKVLMNLIYRYLPKMHLG